MKPPADGFNFIGLLTNRQKTTGLFISQDEDFIYLHHAQDHDAPVIGVFIYEVATVKEIRDHADKYLRELQDG